MRLPVGQLLLVGFSLRVKTAKHRDEIEAETQTSTGEGVQSLLMSSHGINHKWKTLVTLPPATTTAFLKVEKKSCSLTPVKPTKRGVFLVFIHWCDAAAQRLGYLA